MAVRVLKCPGCVFLTVFASRFNEHIHKGHLESSQAMLLCPGCPNTFLNTKSLQIHLELDHQVDPYEMTEILSLVPLIPLKPAPASNGTSIKSSPGSVLPSTEPSSSTQRALLGTCDKNLRTEIKNQQNEKPISQFEEDDSWPTNNEDVQEESLDDPPEDPDPLFVEPPDCLEVQMKGQEESLGVPQVKGILWKRRKIPSLKDICQENQKYKMRMIHSVIKELLKSAPKDGSITQFLKETNNDAKLRELAEQYLPSCMSMNEKLICLRQYSSRSWGNANRYDKRHGKRKG